MAHKFQKLFARTCGNGLVSVCTRSNMSFWKGQHSAFLTRRTVRLIRPFTNNCFDEQQGNHSSLESLVSADSHKYGRFTRGLRGIVLGDTSVVLNSIQRFARYSMQEPPGIDCHRPEREERDWPSQKCQGSAYGFSAMHANRGRQEEDSNQKNQSKHDYGRRNLVRSSKVRFNNPWRGDDATTVEDANCGYSMTSVLLCSFADIVAPLIVRVGHGR